MKQCLIQAFFPDMDVKQYSTFLLDEGKSVGVSGIKIGEMVAQSLDTQTFSWTESRTE